MDKKDFYKDLEALLEKHGVADHFLIAIAVDGEVRTSVRYGSEKGITESNYIRRKALLGEIENQKLIMYSPASVVEKPAPLVGIMSCEHLIPIGTFCAECGDVV